MYAAYWKRDAETCQKTWLGHGWIMVRINGSHHIMIKEGHLPVSIPVHNKDLKIGTEQKILKDLGLK